MLDLELPLATLPSSDPILLTRDHVIAIKRQRGIVEDSRRPLLLWRLLQVVQVIMMPVTTLTRVLWIQGRGVGMRWRWRLMGITRRIMMPREGEKEGEMVPAVMDEKILSSHRMILEVVKGTIGKPILVQKANVDEFC